MKKLLLAFAISLATQQAHAQATSNDFGRSDSTKETLNTAEIRNRFEVLGEIFLTDKNGKLLAQAEESRLWKFGSRGDIESNWSYKTPQIKDIALRQIWSLREDGKINVHIQQFDSMKRKENAREVVTGKLIREQKFELKDFAAVTWIAQEDQNGKVVVRLTPRLDEKTDLIQVESFPITLGSPVVYDSKGRFWAQGRDLEGRYLAIKTHLGQIAFSYAPFKGAKEIGFAQGSQITLQAQPDLKIFVRTNTPVLTTTKPAKLYGFIDSRKKSESYNSVECSSSSEEKEFLEHL